MERAESSASFCTLSSRDWVKRVRWVRDELLPHAITRNDTATGMRWVFPGNERMRATLEDFVTFEAGCCSGAVRFELGSQPGRWVLSIHGLRVGAEGLEEIERSAPTR